MVRPTTKPLSRNNSRRVARAKKRASERLMQRIRSQLQRGEYAQAKNTLEAALTGKRTTAFRGARTPNRPATRVRVPHVSADVQFIPRRAQRSLLQAAMDQLERNRLLDRMLRDTQDGRKNAARKSFEQAKLHQQWLHDAAIGARRDLFSRNPTLQRLQADRFVRQGLRKPTPKKE
jgi:hypothetical protein